MSSRSADNESLTADQEIGESIRGESDRFSLPIGFLSDSAGDYRAGRSFLQESGKVIIRVDHGRSIRRKALQQLGLGGRNSLASTKELDMRNSYIGNYADGWPSDFR